MRRAWIALLVMATALPAAAAEKWWEIYARGVNAMHAKNYPVAVDALQRSLAEMPNENSSARVGYQVIVYVPHFWLGIAKFNLGDTDAALAEWKTSEEQGAVQRTPYYAQLREWVARAEGEKQKKIESAAATSKREANAAVGRAVSAQMDAVAAGADRGDRYRAAQRKLQDAMDAVANAGTDVRAYRRAADIAQQAHDQFVAAAAEAKQRRVPIRAAAPRPAPAPPPVVQPIVILPPPQAKMEPAPEPITNGAPASAGELDRLKPVLQKKQNGRPQLEAAYRAFAAGDLAASDQMLTRVIGAQPSGEAYLLRGCARYTRAVLARSSDLAAAAADFRAALKINRALRLDPAAFSPKLVAFFEQVRSTPRRP